MKKQLLLLVMCLPYITMAQTSEPSTGIKWTTGLSWEEVKQKAKRENKPIFLDVFTTWCGPCKIMDKYVYSNDTVASYFNEKFISVRVQMDKTSKDNDEVKAWYSTAANFTKQYHIEAYPTLIFLSPEAEVIGKELGGRGTKELVAIAQSTVQSGKKYVDKYSEYDQLLVDYKAGRKNYEKMPYMIQVAYQFGDDELASKLLKEHTRYLEELPEEKRYTKENLQLWSGFILDRKGSIFQYFYNNGKLIDKVMNQPGYSYSVIDRTLQKTIVDSFYRIQEGETTLITGKTVKNSEVMFFEQNIMRSDGRINPDKVEADWKKLYKMLRQEVDKKTAERNVLLARIAWYSQHQNEVEKARYTIQLYKKYPPDLKSINVAEINAYGWKVFLYVPAAERKIIKETLKLTKKAIDLYPNYNAMIDTYANLLYKAGKRDEAIKWEEKAVSNAKIKAEKAAKEGSPLKADATPEYFQSVVEQMKRGEKTYIKEGAMWN